LRRDDNSPAPWEEGARKYPCLMPVTTNKEPLNTTKEIQNLQIDSDSISPNGRGETSRTSKMIKTS
jgi:hypothetical protein